MLTKIDGNEIWEILYGVTRDNVPDVLTEEVLDQVATAINHVVANGIDEQSLATALLPVSPDRINEQVKNGGCWKSCSGCLETADGHHVTPPLFAVALGCDLGSGCGECGGLGAVWHQADAPDAFAPCEAVTNAVDWLTACRNWLLTNDLDMECPMVTDPEDIAADLLRADRDTLHKFATLRDAFFQIDNLDLPEIAAAPEWVKTLAREAIAETDQVRGRDRPCMDDIRTSTVKCDPRYPHFGLIGEPVHRKQHPNQQGGLDLYVDVVNFDTGEKCFKKLYENKRGLHFKHTGYSPMYLDDFTHDATVVHFQVLMPKDED